MEKTYTLIITTAFADNHEAKEEVAPELTKEYYCESLEKARSRLMGWLLDNSDDTEIAIYLFSEFDRSSARIAYEIWATKTLMIKRASIETREAES